jgi:hypothetical protein
MWSNQYFSNANIGNLNTGDTVTFSVSDSRLGDLTIQALVPPSPTGFALNPPLPGIGIANTASSYAMTWTAVSGVNWYLPGYRALNVSNSTSFSAGKGFYTTANQWAFYSDDMTLDGTTPRPWLTFYLDSLMKTSISGYRADSWLAVGGPNEIYTSN